MLRPSLLVFSSSLLFAAGAFSQVPTSLHLMSLPVLPAGRWSVKVTAADGRVFETSVETDGRQRRELTIE